MPRLSLILCPCVRARARALSGCRGPFLPPPAAGEGVLCRLPCQPKRTSTLPSLRNNARGSIDLHERPYLHRRQILHTHTQHTHPQSLSLSLSQFARFGSTSARLDPFLTTGDTTTPTHPYPPNMVRSLGLAAAATAAALAIAPSAVSGHAHEGVGFHVPHAERAENEPYFAMLRARYGNAPARVVNLDRIEKRQQSSTPIGAASSAASATAAAGAASSHASGASGAAAGTSHAVTMGTIPIGTTTTLGATSPLPTTYAAGATAPVRGAPNLPAGERKKQPNGRSKQGRGADGWHR